jgi:hypothetical protein
VVATAGKENWCSKPWHKPSHEHYFITVFLDDASHLMIAAVTQNFPKKSMASDAGAEATTQHKDHSVTTEHTYHADSHNSPKVRDIV